MKEEKHQEDIEEVKAKTEEVAVEDARGGGNLVVTPRLRGEAGDAWGLSHANHRNRVTLPWVQAALHNEYSPDAPPLRSAGVAYVVLCCAFCRVWQHQPRNKGGGLGLAVHMGGGGALEMETSARKTPLPASNFLNAK